jgi:hypothetical protein
LRIAGHPRGCIVVFRQQDDISPTPLDQLQVSASRPDLDPPPYVESTETVQQLVEKVRQLEQKLSDATNPSSLNPPPSRSSSSNFLTHRFLLALHYPYAIKAKTDRSFYYSRKVCLETSLFILSHETQSQNDLYCRLRLRGGGIFRAVPLQAICYISGELIHQLENEKVYFNISSTALSRRQLRKAIKDYVELTAARVQSGETNVKGHVLFTALMAQIDAIQNGTGAIVSGVSVSVVSVPKDPRNIGTYMGMGMAMASVAALIGPPINGALVNHYHGIKQVSTFSGVMCLFGAALVIPAKVLAGHSILSKN